MMFWPAKKIYNNDIFTNTSRNVAPNNTILKINWLIIMKNDSNQLVQYQINSVSMKGGRYLSYHQIRGHSAAFIVNFFENGNSEIWTIFYSQG